MKINKTTILVILGIYFLSLFLISFASALTISSVDISPSTIAPGESSTIKLGIENEGSKDVESVSINLDLTNVPFAPFSSSSGVSFDEIREGRVKYAEFDIGALSDAKSGIYKIPIVIKYTVTGETQQQVQNSLIGVTINSKPILDAGIEEGLLLKGRENKISVKITNKGVSDINFLEIELKGGTSYTVLSPKKVYIGAISSDDFNTADFQIFFNDNSLGSITIPATIRYKDSLNNPYEQSFNLQATTYTKQQATNLGLIAKSNTMTYITIVVVVIIIWFIYRAIRKRRKKNVQE